MKKTLTWMMLGMFALPFAGACGGDDDDDDDTPDAGSDGPDADVGGETIQVGADIEEDTTWTAENTYVLTTHIFVRDATLTIEAGTLVQGQEDSSLVVTTSARLVAEGTAEDPIIFTSSAAAGSREAGNWAGVVLLGLAPINAEGGTNNIEGFEAGTEGVEYGGDDATHDCGSLKYVRIEFAGYELLKDNELNGLTLGACGSDTTLDYIQVHLGLDDGVEFFGGTASITHLVVSQPDDDGLDWDLGWTGNAQFVIVQQNTAVGNHGFEADNHPTALDATPRSNPTIWNATLIGSNVDPGGATKVQGGMMIRKGTAASINNSIVAYFADWAADVADYATVLQTEGAEPALSVNTTYFFDNANDDQGGFPDGFDVIDLDSDPNVEELGEDDCQTPAADCDGFDEAAYFAGISTNVLGTDPMLEDPLNLAAPDFAPVASSPVLDAGDTPPQGFDTSATFVGAIGDADWTAGWTAYPAN